MKIYIFKTTAVYQKFKDKKRRDYNSNKIEKCDSTKQIHAISNSLLGKTKCSTLPLDIPEHFCDYFAKKIKLISENLDSGSAPLPMFHNYNGLMLNEFLEVSEDSVARLSQKCLSSHVY